MPVPDNVRRSPTTVSLGTTSLIISSLFVFSSNDKLDSPVATCPLGVKHEDAQVRC